MTEEEFFRKNYPDSCYGDKPLSPHWDFFQDGVEFGERKSEKQIEIDAKQIRALQKQNGELTDKVKELKERADKADLDSVIFFNQLCKAEEIIKELLNSCFGYNSKTVNYEVKAKAEQFLKENA